MCVKRNKDNTKQTKKQIYSSFSKQNRHRSPFRAPKVADSGPRVRGGEFNPS